MINESVKTIVEVDTQQVQQKEVMSACSCEQSRLYNDEEVDDITF